MYLLDYVQQDIKNRENVCKHLRNISELLKEVIEEICAIEDNLYISDEEDINEN